MAWTRFMDMHSGGSQKLDFSNLYIEAPEAVAKAVFFNRFGRSPDRVTCTCCGKDYSITEEETLELATAYERGCRYDNKLDQYVEEGDPKRSYQTYVPLAEYIAAGIETNGLISSRDGEKPKVAFIYAADIKPEETAAEIPAQGYVWVG